MSPPDDDFSYYFSVRRHPAGSRKVGDPTNREVEIINKSREVNMADLQLQRVRQLYLTKTQELNLRWRKVETGQLELKQNLVKFNNFVRCYWYVLLRLSWTCQGEGGAGGERGGEEETAG